MFIGDVNEFDAVLFHAFGLNQFTPIPNQTERQSHQRYVMFVQEPPLMDFNDHARFNNFFNWTSTYRWDSDFIVPYGWIDSKKILKTTTPTNKYTPNLEFELGNGK